MIGVRREVAGGEEEVLLLPRHPVVHLVHPTKTGGTALREYLIDMRSDMGIRFVYDEHYAKCSEKNECTVITLREPIDRFLSMYKYWKNGSEKYQACAEMHAFLGTKSVKDFIQLLKTNNSNGELTHTHYVRNVHYVAQSSWIQGCPYEKLCVVRYDVNLFEDRVHALMRYLGMREPYASLPKINVSSTRRRGWNDDEAVLDARDVAFVREAFRSDFALWQRVTEQPELFAFVA